MSRAFVREDDGSRPEALPELPVSAAPNLVTARGLRLIEARIAAIEAELDAGPDEAQTARLRRDLRYWSLRHATARLTSPAPDDPGGAVRQPRHLCRRGRRAAHHHHHRRGRGRPGGGPHRLHRPGRPRAHGGHPGLLRHRDAARPAG